MNRFNFNNKRFALVENSNTGKVNAETIFDYKQEGSLVTADYHGGTIKYGKIIAHLQGDRLNMLYQCITTNNEMKAGKAIAKITVTDEDKMKLNLEWQWLTDDLAKGQSEYIEIV